jgi:hypothetical protein
MKSFLTALITPRAAVAVATLALIASVVSGREKPDLEQESTPPARADTSAARGGAPASGVDSAPDLDLANLKRVRTDQAIADLFAAPPAPAPAQEAAGQPAPRPSAPPLPFQFVARITDDGNTTVYVMLGEDHYSAKAGLVIDRNYRVEKVTETAVTFTYLPLGIRQVLALN